MAAPTDTVHDPSVQDEPAADFTLRLERSLGAADAERRRRQLRRRMQSILPVVLLIGPVIAWRLILLSPGSAHVAIDFLAWVTFCLDVAVRVDTGVLSYLGLKALPSIVGVLLLVLITGWLLSSPRGEE